MTVKGTCSCQKIGYEISGELCDATACHCSMCRKTFGSYASAFATIKPNEFSWLKGKELLSSYDSSKNMSTLFCSNCGSTLGGTYNNEICWVTLGCVLGEPDIKIASHIYMGSKAKWETNPTEVTEYDELP